ncbi:MAG: tetratricopeptide repeat protein, partial [Steroidobacteraceae bacterium]
WWDPEIAAGQEFDRAISAELKIAGAVVVVWTPNSVGSRWVRGEAREGAERGILVPIRFGGADLPIDVRALHTTDFDDWGEDSQSPQIREVIRALEAILPNRRSTQPAAQNPGAAQAAAHTKSHAALPEKTGQRPRLVLFGLTAVIAVVLAYLVVDEFWLSKHVTDRHAGQARDNRSIAVLPFTDLSEKKDQEYFADGLAEEIRNLLGNIPTLKVIGRTSSVQFKGRGEDLRAIGAQLGAAYVLEGSVRRAGDRVRVTAQLIGTQDGVNRWSKTYDRTISDVLELQDELAAGLARALQIDVGADSLRARAPLISPEAYELYLRAMHEADRQDREGFETAVNHLQQVLQLDPTFAAATTELAWILALQADFKFAPVGETYERARRYAEAAIRLDPKSGTPHAVLCWIHMTHDWDWPAADLEAKEALRLTPHETLALKCAARLSEVLGHWDESARLSRASLARDPLDFARYILLSSVYFRAGSLTDAEAAIRRAIEINPNHAGAPFSLAQILLVRGRPLEALAAMQRTTDERFRMEGLVSIYYALGRQADSDAALAWLTREHASDGAYGIARAHAFRGEVDDAFRWLDRAFEQRDPHLHRIKGDPMLKRLEGDPRYQAFLRKMKLPE